MKKDSQRKEFLNLVRASLKEMEKNQTVLLVRGDKIREEDLPLYSVMYRDLKSTLEKVAGGEDVNRMIRHKDMNIFMKHESFFMDLFETHRFPKLFDLFEYE